MSFPDLEVESEKALHSKAQGVPVDGPNEFAIGISPRDILGKESNLYFDVKPLGTSVIATSETAVLSADRTKATINFSQRGSDECLIEAVLDHSSIR